MSEFMDLSVCKMDRSRNNKYKKLYEGIKTLEEAELLAQLSMCNKQDYELIFIFPGWNRSINNNDKYKEDYNKSLLLAEKYKIGEVK